MNDLTTLIWRNNQPRKHQKSTEKWGDAQGSYYPPLTDDDRHNEGRE